MDSRNMPETHEPTTIVLILLLWIAAIVCRYGPSLVF